VNVSRRGDSSATEGVEAGGENVRDVEKVEGYDMWAHIVNESNLLNMSKYFRPVSQTSLSSHINHDNIVQCAENLESWFV
jgi:hypothetical protein